MRIARILTLILIILFGTGFTPRAYNIKNVHDSKLPSELPRIALNTYLESVQAEIEETIYYDIPLSNELQDFTKNQAEYEGMSYELVLSIMEVESSFDSDIISITNDYGIMQIHESNHQEMYDVFGITDIMDTKNNIVCGIYLLKMAYNKCDGDLHKTLMTYNMGFNGAKKYWDKGIYESDYSRKVVNVFEKYRNMERY